MALVGRFNTLQIVKETDFGLYLDGGVHGEILLPNRYVPKDEDTSIEEWLNVFVHHDSEDRLIATTLKPKIQVGGFASLKVVQINSVGLFLDWGLPKDLFMPHSEEKRPLQVGDYCVVHAYLDQRSGRITATARLDRYLDRAPAAYQEGQAVDVLIADQTDLGFKVIINDRHWGLLHKNELFRFVRSGMREKAYIKPLRADGKISVSLQPVGSQAGDMLSEQILTLLKASNGVINLGDKSPPEAIAKVFNVSKGSFKKAIGGLYKKSLIQIEDECIRLV